MQTVDFIETIVNSMTPTIEIDTVTDNLDGTQTLTVCNSTYWIRDRLTITIDGNDYTVLSFVKDTSITISDTPTVTASSFTLTAPYYFHGYPRQVNNEWMIQRIDNDKYPLVYMVESQVDNFYDEEDQKDKDMNLRIFFLDSLTNNNDEVDAHYSNTVVPLRSMLSHFVDLLKEDSTTLPFSYDVTNWIEVGTPTTDAGTTQEIFSDTLDGVEFVGTVTVLKSNDCTNC